MKFRRFGPQDNAYVQTTNTRTNRHKRSEVEDDLNLIKKANFLLRNSRRFFANFISIYKKKCARVQILTNFKTKMIIEFSRISRTTTSD